MLVFQSVIKVLEHSALGTKNEKIFKVAKWEEKGCQFLCVRVCVYSQILGGLNAKSNMYPIENTFLAFNSFDAVCEFTYKTELTYIFVCFLKSISILIGLIQPEK